MKEPKFKVGDKVAVLSAAGKFIRHDEVIGITERLLKLASGGGCSWDGRSAWNWDPVRRNGDYLVMVKPRQDEISLGTTAKPQLSVSGGAVPANAMSGLSAIRNFRPGFAKLPGCR